MNSILVVEDELLILNLMTDVLEMYGYQVRAFQDADTAWSFIEKSQNPPRLLITDLQMPGEIDGVGLVKRTKANFPEVPIIVSTGFHPAATELNHQNLHWLLKPFDIDQLHAICKTLAPIP